MRDVFEFETPMGTLGSFVNYNFLKGYMTRLLLKRNEVINAYAESVEGQVLLRNK
jgi:hypothetical protein